MNWKKVRVTDITQDEFDWVCSIFKQKYKTSTECIVRLERYTDLYQLDISAALVLDMVTFRYVKDLLPCDILSYSNEPHPMWRSSRPGRTITYFGSYPYQPHDVYTILKLYFDIHKPAAMGYGVYVASMDMEYIAKRADEWESLFDRPVITKKPNTGSGNIFDYVDCVHYVHTGMDKNNRTIPEAFWHGKTVTYEDRCPTLIDSTSLRFPGLS